LVEVQLAKFFYGVSYTLPLDGMRQFATFINITDWFNLEENSTQFYFYKKICFPGIKVSIG
jgi:hypothetical protein